MGTSTRVDDLVDASALRLRTGLLRRAVGAGGAHSASPGVARELEAAWAAAADRVPVVLEEWRARTRPRVRRAQVALMEDRAAVAAVRGWTTRCARALGADAQAVSSPVLAQVLREAAELVLQDLGAVQSDVDAVRDVQGSPMATAV